MEASMSTEVRAKGSHCSYCGTRFTEQHLWPRKCFRCWNVSYVNPIPVVVAIVPVYDIGYHNSCFLIEQRNIEPKKGGWALPSGFVDAGESWQQAAVRELQEEVGLTTNPEDFRLLDVLTAPNGNMLIFVAHSGVDKKDIKFVPNEEVSAIQFPLSPSEIELCFPTHNEMWLKYCQASPRIIEK